MTSVYDRTLTLPTLGEGEGVRSQPFGGGVGYSVAPWLRKFGSIHSRNVGSKVVWNDIAHSCCNWQLSKHGIRWPVSHDLMVGSRFCPIEVTCFSFFTRTAHKISGVLIWTSGRTSDPKSQPFLQVRKAVTIELNYLKYLSSWCFENQPKEICTHLSEKASEVTRLFGLDKLQNHTNEKRKGEETWRKRKSEEQERRRRGKRNGCTQLVL